MKKNKFEFIPFTFKNIESKISKRDGETKIGEKILFDFENPKCKYVIIGVSEDIGPQANGGMSGAKNAFNSFLSRFINMQNNQFLNSDRICLYGEIIQNTIFGTIDQARKDIEELDELMMSIIKPIIKLGKLPIIIGGGHNNAYPLIKSSATAYSSSINVINLDPHADCRALEGRHSGNPFSYAKEENSLNHYSVIGLHQQYNNDYIYNYLTSKNFDFTFFEDYLFENRNFETDVELFIKKSKGKNFGIELDLDCIRLMPTSAFSPSGFTIEQARKYIFQLSKNRNVCYLHLPEGAPSNEYEEKIIGKTLAYIVTDFIKGNSSL